MFKCTDKLVSTFSGLLSEKPDNSLFFLDVGQQSKAESTGEHAPTQQTIYLVKLFLGVSRFLKFLGEILDL